MLDMLDYVDIDLDEADVMDTIVSVHSPVVFSSKNGSAFTTYAISLKSSNSCFSQPYSCVRRRYSEFVHLRKLLKSHIPNIEPPSLPPKMFFNRFNQFCINDRAEGLQNFLRSVLNTPVYLSDKAVHLFLQSKCAMTEIDERVCGDIPPPKLIGVDDVRPISHSDSSSSLCDSVSLNCDHKTSLSALLPADQQSAESSYSSSIASASSDESPSPAVKSLPVPILPPHLRGKLYDDCSDGISSPCSSNGSFSSTDSTTHTPRHVSFNEEVKVALVRNQYWNIHSRPIRASAC